LLVAGALALVYAIVIPSLERNLVDGRLQSLSSVAPQVARTVPLSPEEYWSDTLETASSTAEARVVVYDVLTGGETPILSVYQDSHHLNSADVEKDRTAVSAARRIEPTDGTVTRGDTRYAEVALPIVSPAPYGRILLFSSSLDDALATVDTVQGRVLEAGVIGLAAAGLVGYGLAFLFAGG